jgi:hypothetical protein
MRNFSMRFCVILAVAMSSNIALAQDYHSANRRMPACREFIREGTIATYESGICYGLVSSILYLDDETCHPKITIGQGVRVVVKYIDERPARHHEDFRALALEALRAAWPCPR